MALVPRARHQAQSVAPTPVVGVQAAQSGAGHLARGLNDVGDAFQDWQDEIDTADAKAADAQFSDEVRKLLYEDGNGFMNRMGGNAVRERKGVSDLLREKQEQILGGLSGSARRKAQDAIQGRYQGALQRVDTHTSGQRRTFLNDTANARVKSAINDAIYDPDQVSQSIALVVQEARDAGARNGSSPEVIKGQIVEAQTKIHSGIVARISAQSPIEAMRYLQDNKGKMLGSEVARLTTQLAPAVKEYKGRQAGRRALSQGSVDPSTFNWSKYAVGGAAARSNSFTGLDQEYASRVARMLQAADAELGDGALKITSAFRSVEKQRELFEAAVKKYGSVAEARKWVAPPGKSRHNSGTAVDFAGKNGGLLRDASSREAVWIKNNAARFGLDVPMSWEPWQVELAGSRDGSKTVAPAPTSGGGIGSLLDIADPDERAAAIREYNLISGVQSKQAEARRDQAADAAFKIIESGGNVDDLPIDFRQNLGREEMSSLRTYQDKVASGDKVETDPEQYVLLSKIASENPDGFTKLNPIAWRDKLDDGDFEKFVDLQRTIRNSGREEAKKKSVLVDAPTISSLRTASTASLKAAGLDTKSNPKTIAAFERELVQWADAFTRQGNVKPTPVEINSKINQMLTPVVLNPSGIWNKTDRTQEKPAFQIDYDGNALDPDDDMTLADIRSASIKINGEDVDGDLLDRFVGGFTEAMGRNPTAQEVVDGLIESGVFQ